MDDLIDLARKPEARDWTRGDIEDWVNESLEAARQAYRIPGSKTCFAPACGSAASTRTRICLWP